MGALPSSNYRKAEEIVSPCLFRALKSFTPTSVAPKMFQSTSTNSTISENSVTSHGKSVWEQKNESWHSRKPDTETPTSSTSCEISQRRKLVSQCLISLTLLQNGATKMRCYSSTGAPLRDPAMN